MSKTEFFAQWTQGNMVMEDQSKSTGKRFWVHSGTGTDSTGYGLSPESPFASLDYAVGQCTDNKNDIIYVMPGHTETKSASGSLFALDVAGIRVIGLGQGADRPEFTFSHTGAATTISANGITVENVILIAGVDSVTAPVTISGADVTLRNIEWRDTTDIEFVRGFVTTAAADRLTVEDCLYNGYTGGNACVNGFRLIGVDQALIRNCRFQGLFLTGAIEFITTACTKVWVDGCQFLNTGTALTKNVVNTGGIASTWQATNCYDCVGDYKFSGGDGAAVASDDISTVNSIVTTVSAGVSTVSSIATTVSAGVSTVSSIATTTSAGVSTVNSIVTTTSAGVSTVNSIVTTVSAGVSTADSRVTTTSAGVSTVSSIVTTISAGVNTVSTAVSTVNSIVTTVSAGVSTADSRITTTSTGVSTVSSIVTTASAGVSTVNSIVTTVSAGVSAVNSIVTTVSAGTSTVSSIVTTVSAGVSTVSSIVTTVSTAISTINNWDVRTVAKTGLDLSIGGATDVFTIAGGPIELRALIMVVTVAVSANACNTKWQIDPDLVGAGTVDLCANVDILSAAIGDVFGITGTATDAMVKYTAGPKFPAASMFLQAGGVDLVQANADPTTGTATVYLTYRPLAAGATVTAP